MLRICSPSQTRPYADPSDCFHFMRAYPLWSETALVGLLQCGVGGVLCVLAVRVLLHLVIIACVFSFFLSFFRLGIGWLWR